ncbi:insulinase family protein [Bacteroidota bacterium]
MKKLISVYCLNILFICGLISINLFAQSGNDAGQKYLTGDNIEQLPNGVFIHQLDNGMQVLLIENPALPMVGVNVVVKVGSAYETFSTSGMSHMLEHLLFNGTDDMTQKELYDATDKIGGYNNAHTSSYGTNYMMVTPAENIYKGMKLQAGMLFHSILPEDKFEKEKGIVMEEIAKSLANSGEQAERNINSIIYNGHALSLPTLGTYETIKNMNRNDVNDFYQNYYVPNNMIMNVIGNFKRNEMVKMIEEIYGTIPPGNVKMPESPVWGTGFQNIKYDAAAGVYHRFYSGKDLLASVLYELDSNLSLKFFDLLDISVGNVADSLQKIIDEKYPGAIKSISFQTRVFPVKNYLQATLKFTSDENLDNIINLFNKELRNQNFALAPEVINTEAVKTRTDFIKNIEKPHMFGIYNADKIAEYGIEAVFNSYSKTGYSKTGKFLKEFSIKVKPITIIQHPLVAEETDGLVAAISTELIETGNNKPTLIVKQNSGSELLAIHYMIKNKAAYEEKYGKNAATILHDAFGQRMNSTENKKESIGYGFAFTVNDNPFIPMDNIYLSPAFGYIRVEGLADDIPGAINYLNTEMLNFFPTQEEFDKAVKNIHGAGMMQRENKARKIFEEKYRSIIYKPEKYSTEGKELTYESLLEFSKEYFNPQNMVISVVSPASVAEINDYFAGFYIQESIEPMMEPAYRDEYATVTEAVTVEDTVGGEQAYLFYGYLVDIEKNDEAELRALSLLLRDKIVFDIREKQGMAYRMSAGITTIDDKALFYINMGTRPENVDILVPQFPGFFTNDYTSSFTDEELNKRVNMYLGRMMFRRLSSINQAYYLGHSYYFDNDITADEDALNKLKDVTIGDVMRVAEKYLNVKNPVKVVIR